MNTVVNCVSFFLTWFSSLRHQNYSECVTNCNGSMPFFGWGWKFSAWNKKLKSRIFGLKNGWFACWEYQPIICLPPRKPKCSRWFRNSPSEIPFTHRRHKKHTRLIRNRVDKAFCDCVCSSFPAILTCSMNQYKQNEKEREKETWKLALAARRLWRFGR